MDEFDTTAWARDITDAPPQEEPESCCWQVWVGSLETPPEFCGLDAEPGGDYCPRHRERAEAMTKWEPPEEPNEWDTP